MTKTCERCGTEYSVKPSRGNITKYCSFDCQVASRTTKVEHWCELCGKPFMVVKSRSERGKARYCSRKCKDNAFTKRADRPCDYCGEIFSPTYASTILGYGRFCSRKCMGMGRRGENGPGWKGGITPENAIIRASTEYREWRDAVYTHDNWTCQDCRVRGGVLHAHHVFTFAEFPDHRFDVWNGITLCKSCHAKTHSGVKDNMETI